MSFGSGRFTTDSAAEGLVAYLRTSPSPFHAVASSLSMLVEAGFTPLDERDAWPSEPGRYVTTRGGSLVAWSTERVLTRPFDGSGGGADDGDAGGERGAVAFRVVGAHTDSPNLRIKPRPDHERVGWQLLGVEPYGGLLLNSWLDRDLGLSGRVAVREADGSVGERLFAVDEPLLRVSQLAIHLDRSTNDALTLNKQLHMEPSWALSQAPLFVEWLAEQVRVEPVDVLSWDAMTHDVQPAARTGLHREFVAGARMDNLATSYAATQALIDAVERPAPEGEVPLVPLIALFDHEEIGSMSERGAFSNLLPTIFERIISTLGGGRDDVHRAMAHTVIASGDMAHATHPNYADRHEPAHHIAMNGGPVLKINTNLRYATDSVGAAHFAAACREAGVPMQEFVVRSDLPCGSTVGPMTAALTGATTVDFGAPTLSMHSARELVGAADQAMYGAALAAFLAPGRD